MGVEAVWALISPKARNPRYPLKYVAVCYLYYRGPKSTNKTVLFDYIAESYNILCTKYGKGLEFIYAGDTNRLNLSPILDLCPSFKQVVKVFTRLNPGAILDIIITSLSKYYQDPVMKPPINNNADNGKPSDHLVVIMQPITSVLECPPRLYKTVEYRPLTDSGMVEYGRWLSEQTWNEIYVEMDCHKKAEIFHKILMDKFLEIFPILSMKVCSEDQAWVSRNLKLMDRKRKREFLKIKDLINGKS